MELRPGMQRCPAHDDKTASLSVKEEDGKWLIYCFAGCETKDVIDALGLTWDDLFVLGDGRVAADSYVYVDENGEPLVRVVRTEPKGFWQEHYEDGKWLPGARQARKTLYHLPAVLQTAKDRGRIYVCEGEKDAETIRTQGACATTNVGGAQAWRDEYDDALRGADIFIVGDADDAGRSRVERISQSLTSAGMDYTVVFPREGKDVTELVSLGFGLADLVEESPDLAIFSPLSWEDYETASIEWLWKPYVPAHSRVLAFGSAGSLKSLWAMWLAAKLTQQGKKVAYFSLEMPAGETAKRFKQADAVPEFLSVFTRFQFNNAQHITYAIRALKGYDLIIIDSWSAAHHESNNNDAVAILDNEVFQPIITQTGATLLILDNTGKDTTTDDGNKIESDSARGASAKADKMELTLWFHRPEKANNYKTRLEVKKMRLDHAIPPPLTMETSQNKIDFWRMENGNQVPVWDVGVRAKESKATVREDALLPTLTVSEQLALARLEGMFGVVRATDQD